MCQTRFANSSSGQSNASACTSCGSAIVTAPVSAGSVSTRIAPSRACASISGRHTRSKNRHSGRNASLTWMSYPVGCSSSCSTGLPTLVAKMSLGSNSTGCRFVVATRGAGQHVRRARPDRRGAGHGLQPVERAGVAGGRVHHALLVAGQVVGQVRLTRGGRLQQRLPDARHVAVAEDPEGTRDQSSFHTVALAVLVRQEPHHRLRDGQSHRCHLPDLLGSSSRPGGPPGSACFWACPGTRRAACRRPGRRTDVRAVRPGSDRQSHPVHLVTGCTSALPAEREGAP